MRNSRCLQPSNQRDEVKLMWAHARPRRTSVANKSYSHSPFAQRHAAQSRNSLCVTAHVLIPNSSRALL